MNPDKLITKILDYNEHNIIQTSRVLKNSEELDNNNYLDTFNPNIDKNICTEAGLEYVSVLESPEYNFNDSKAIVNNNISISTAAAVLS